MGENVAAGLVELRHGGPLEGVAVQQRQHGLPEIPQLLQQGRRGGRRLPGSLPSPSIIAVVCSTPPTHQTLDPHAKFECSHV